MPLRFDHVSKGYGERRVLRSFSHTFPRSGVVLVRGPSGCGKTTMLRLIAGLERPDSGAVHLPAEARVSMVFQEDRLLPTLTARGNVLAVLGKATPELVRQADACLAGCGLQGEEETYPAQMSGGMRRRVALARAVAYGGDILLLDEPFKGLDPELKRQVMDFVLADRSRLTLLVTHDKEEAKQADDTLKTDQWPWDGGEG